MKSDERAQLAAAGTALILTGVAALNYVRVARSERKKRQKIEQWKLENLACIHNSHQRLLDEIEAPDFSWDKLAKAMDEEGKFLAIVRNQPKY